MRGGHKRRVACPRCGRVISARSGSNETVAHKCPHGTKCQAPAWSRSAAGECEACASMGANTLVPGGMSPESEL